MKDTLRKEKMFSHSIDKVWKAITDAEEISSWFIQADFEPKVGYQYTFTAPEAQNCSQIVGEVKEATPYTLVYTWIVKDTNVETMVRWVLDEVDGKTRLVLEHTGIANYDGETAVAMFNSFNGGWDHCMVDLEEYLEKSLYEA